MNEIDTFEIPLKIDNGEGNSKAKVCVKRHLANNKLEDNVTIIWMDEYNEESECCYYSDLNNDNKKIVDNAIYEFDLRQVQKDMM